MVEAFGNCVVYLMKGCDCAVLMFKTVLECLGVEFSCDLWKDDFFKCFCYGREE